MAYKRNTYRFKNSIEIEEYYNGRYGAPGESREKKKKATPEQIKDQNMRNKEKRVRRKIKANFEENDYFADLTYIKDKRPPTMKDAKKDFKKFIRTVKSEYKKRKKELKWIRNIEIGERGGTHCHIIINRIADTDLIMRKAWEKGGVHMTMLYESGDYKKLGGYVCKVPTKENKLLDASHSCSRNLKIVEPETDIVVKKTLEDAPRNRKGYYIDKESLVEGINQVTGYRYRHYTFIKIKERGCRNV